MAIERTFGMIKPDAVQAGKTGEILAAIEQAGLRIVALRRTRYSLEEARAFYAVHRERPFYDSLCEFMSSGPIVVMVLQGENAIARWRDLMGPTDSKKAGPDTIRGRFGTDISYNAVHGSDSPETAAQEIPFAFSARELL